MDTETFEQIALQENLVDVPQFLKDGQEVTVLMNTETELLWESNFLIKLF